MIEPSTLTFFFVSGACLSLPKMAENRSKGQGASMNGVGHLGSSVEQFGKK